MGALERHRTAHPGDRTGDRTGDRPRDRPRGRPRIIRTGIGRVVVLLAGALALAACSGDGGGGGTDPDDPSAAAPATEPGDHDDIAGERAGPEGDAVDGDPGDGAPEVPPVREYVIDPPVRESGLVRLASEGDDGDPGENGDVAEARVDGGVDGTADEFVEVPADEVPAGFSSQLQLVDRGVEIDAWTEPEGAVALLRILAGEAPRSTVGGLDLVVSHSSTPVVRLARSLVADDDTPDAERAELERLLDALVPSADVLDEVAAAARHVDLADLADLNVGGDSGAVGDDDDTDDGTPTGFRRAGTGDGDTGSGDDCIDPSRVAAHPEFVAFDAECWQSITTTVPSPTGGESQLVVFYSERHTEFAQPTLDALVRSVEFGHDWSNAVPSTSLVIRPGEGTVDENTGDEDTDGTGDDAEGEPRTAAGIGGFADATGGLCFVTMVVDDGIEVTDAYRQVVAHEQTHCLQFAAYGMRGEGIGREADEWFIEGGAEYFSHVIYPTGRAEREHVAEFLTESLNKALMTMDYPTWVWWQYLANQTSPAHVFELHGRMYAGDAVEVLADEPGMAETLQDFAVDLMHRGIDTEADPIPASSLGLPHGTIRNTGTRTEDVGRFVVARVAVDYAGEQRYEQTDQTAGDGRYDMVAISQRLDRGAWGPVPPEVRAECDDSRYLLALTTVSPDTYQVRWHVDDVADDECDDCLVGTWLLDNEGFVETMEAVLSLAEAQGGQMPPGVDFSWSFVGPYHLRLDDEGGAVSWRDDWRMVMEGSVQGITFESITIIDSIETFTYRGDGERLELDDIAVVDITARTEHRSSAGVETGAVVTPDSATANIFGQTATLDTETGVDDAPASVTGSYTCDDQTLAITFDETPGVTMRWNRVADAPEPPAT